MEHQLLDCSANSVPMAEDVAQRRLANVDSLGEQAFKHQNSVSCWLTAALSSKHEHTILNCYLFRNPTARHALKAQCSIEACSLSGMRERQQRDCHIPLQQVCDCWLWLSTFTTTANSQPSNSGINTQLCYQLCLSFFLFPGVCECDGGGDGHRAPWNCQAQSRQHRACAKGHHHRWPEVWTGNIHGPACQVRFWSIVLFCMLERL